MLSAAKLLKKGMGRCFVVKFFKKVASAVTFFIYSKLLCAPHFFTRLTTKTQSQRDFHNEKVALAVSVLSLTGRFYIQTPHRDKQRSQQGHSCFSPLSNVVPELNYIDNARILKKLPENTTQSQPPISQSTEAQQFWTWCVWSCVGMLLYRARNQYHHPA